MNSAVRIAFGQIKAYQPSAALNLQSINNCFTIFFY